MSDTSAGMDPEKFIKVFYEKVIISNTAIYRDLYFSGKNTGSKDPISDKILKFIGGLSKEQKEAAMLLCRQAMVDTSSNVFSIIDGAADFDSPRDQFELTYRGGELLSGGLQDLFLEEDDERRMEGTSPES